MAASKWRLYREFRGNLGKKVFNLHASDTLKCALCLSTSNCGDVALATAQYATLTNQHANQYGYTTGGVTVASTWTQSGNVTSFDIDNPQWTASGGSIVARYAVLYDDTATNKDLIAYCILDATPADVTCTTGNTFTITVTNVSTDTGGEE